jgi:hypothetical protein
MTTRKTKTAPHPDRAMAKSKLTITAAVASRYGLNSHATFSVGADVFCRAAEHALASPPLNIGSELKITVELPVSLAVEIGICAHMLVRVQRAAYQVVFAPAARNRLRGTICQDIEVAWDAKDARMQAIGPVYALEHPHLAALELVWHKLHEMAAADLVQGAER